MSRPRARPRSYHLDAAGRLRRDLPAAGLAEVYRSGEGRLWVDIDSGDDEWALLGELFRFHPLAIEDTRSPNCRVKVEEYEGYVFIVARGVHFVEETPDPYDLDTHNLYLFLGGSFLVSVHAGPFTAVETVVQRLEAGAESLARGVDHLAYTLLDTLVDAYFPLLDRIDEFIDEIEHEIFDGARAEMGRIFDLKRTLAALRRYLSPMREAMSALANRPTPFLRPEVQIYLRDVHDHVIRQLEAVETYRELMTGALETQLALISNRMNEIIKALSVIATIVLPPTFIASVYGMNFEWMPWLDDPNGFWIAVAGMLGITVLLMVYLRWKGWF